MSVAATTIFWVRLSIHSEMIGNEHGQRVAHPIELCGESTLIFLILSGIILQELFLQIGLQTDLQGCLCVFTRTFFSEIG